MANMRVENAEQGRSRHKLLYRPGAMPPLYGDTAAVLIVDDDPQVAELLERILKSEGYRCDIAANAAEARARLTDQAFAVALVDIRMPDESGLELVADLLTQHEHLAAVMVTGVGDPGVAELALERGAYGYLVKPFQANDVVITVANAGRRRCLEIERALAWERLNWQMEVQTADLSKALARLDEIEQDPLTAATLLDTGATYRALLDAAPDAIVGVDQAGRIALVNGQAERLFGYSRDELVGQVVELLVPEIAKDVHPERRRQYLANPEPRPMGAGMELAGRRKDGSEFPAEISLSAIETRAGILVSAAIRDVTDRKRADAKFRGLLEAAPDAIVGVDRSGRIAVVNAQAERLFGYDRTELVGQLVEILVPEAARAVHPGRRTGYFDDPQARRMGAGMELAGRRKDGSEFPAEISLSALETEDGLLVSAAVRNVTERIEAQAERERLRAQAERERLESRLQQSQRLESLGQLAGGVAHDFNNLLAVILNYAAFIGEEVTAAATVEGGEHWVGVQRDVAQVERAARRATELTHQLLVFGRREVVRPKVLNLNDVVRDVEQLLRRSLGEHVELVTRLTPELHMVMADPGQIEQVLVNLAVNARDAMPAGGTLTIETANVTVDLDYISVRPGLAAGHFVRLRVSDTGIGMAREVAVHVFEPFFSTKPRGEGSGLGLATVYGIITQAGGDAQIYSEPGTGTTFTALLPATEVEPAGEEHPARRARRGGGETVLLVEDEEAMREVTRRILDRNGHNVLVASGGVEAVAFAAHYPGEIDLLLTDVVMPQLLGKEVAERVVALRPRVRVLYMSGYAQPVLASQGTLAEGVTLLEKPFSEEGLLDKVREVLDA